MSRTLPGDLRRWRWMPLLLGLAFSFGAVGAAEAVPTEVAQSLVRRYGATIVEVNTVLSVNTSAGDKALPAREIKLDGQATLIAPDGLAVVSLASIDPSDALDGARVTTPRGPMRIEVTSVEFKLVKLRFPDGTEVEARVVLKDPDLDVAFIKPITPLSKPVAYVDLARDAWPQLLSTGYIVGRSTRIAHGAPVVRRVDIISVAEKPRRIIIPEMGVQSCPMFDATGRVYGLCVRQYARGRPVGDLVLPAKELAEIAAQAAAINVEPVKPAGESPETKEPAVTDPDPKVGEPAG